ncbi:MAG: flagellar biosynthesis repressor FlbT [Alphaproteobacteria bacterium]|nr:flagellar biosynthesis repressor FlbT [Alphaproteobacteria bacterium]MBO4643295.1 flagellar biosynthesis repressor FlbT [Alphaproteobacteria bacterium]
MPLKIELKPGERLIVGNALITNDKERVKLFIEGNVPILREKYVLTEKEADTPCKKVYYVLQEMYLAKDPKILHPEYFARISEITKAAPSFAPAIDELNNDILSGDYYSALKHMMALIEKEAELLERAKGK